MNRYPGGSAAALRERIAEKFGLSAEQVQVGAGSVSVLAQLIQAASGPGDEIVYAWRSFEAYPLLVATAGSTAVEVPLTPGYRHDLRRWPPRSTTRTRMVIVCSPNNPTSTVHVRRVRCFTGTRD